MNQPPPLVHMSEVMGNKVIKAKSRRKNPSEKGFGENPPPAYLYGKRGVTKSKILVFSGRRNQIKPLGAVKKNDV